MATATATATRNAQNLHQQQQQPKNAQIYAQKTNYKLSIHFCQNLNGIELICKELIQYTF
jgi:hypothetical protein